jgi:hypothetical protein
MLIILDSNYSIQTSHGRVRSREQKTRPTRGCINERSRLIWQSCPQTSQNKGLEAQIKSCRQINDVDVDVKRQPSTASKRRHSLGALTNIPKMNQLLLECQGSAGYFSSFSSEPGTRSSVVSTVLLTLDETK